MTEQEKLIKQLRLHEGVRNKPYTDTVGKLTIGVGRNLSDVGLLDDEIDYLLNNDVRRVCLYLDAQLPWWQELNDVRQRVMIDLCFNMGIKSLLTFKNTLKAIKDRNWQAAYKGMLSSKWAKQVDKNLNDHEGRANRLADMMLTGKDFL
jgi:lysozyme